MEPRRFPSLKRFLFKIHSDLRKVASDDYSYSGKDLSDVEVLIILLEDKRFIQHWGIDTRSVIREITKMLAHRKHGGASTIDMQLVRTKTGFKEHTLRRKTYEMMLAFLLQYRMSKLAILRSYMQCVYLGWGIRGIDDAAMQVFNKQIWDLTREQSAAIAAMMVYPKPRNVTEQWQQKVDRRARYGLALFVKLGHRYKQRFE